MSVIPEAFAIKQGLIPASGFGRYVNTITQRGKASVAAIPFVIGYVWFEYKYFNGWRKEVQGRKKVYNDRMAVIKQEVKEWSAAGKQMPKKQLVENERLLSPDHSPIIL